MDRQSHRSINLGRTLDPWTPESQGFCFSEKKHIHKNSGLTIASSLSSLQEKTLVFYRKNTWFTRIVDGFTDFTKTLGIPLEVPR